MWRRTSCYLTVKRSHRPGRCCRCCLAALRKTCSAAGSRYCSVVPCHAFVLPIWPASVSRFATVWPAMRRQSGSLFYRMAMLGLNVSSCPAVVEVTVVAGKVVAGEGARFATSIHFYRSKEMPRFNGRGMQAVGRLDNGGFGASSGAGRGRGLNRQQGVGGAGGAGGAGSGMGRGGGGGGGNFGMGSGGGRRRNGGQGQCDGSGGLGRGGFAFESGFARACIDRLQARIQFLQDRLTRMRSAVQKQVGETDRELPPHGGA